MAAIGQQGFAVLHFLLIARWLSPTELGEWAMFVTLVSFADMVRLGLVQNAMIHFGARHEGIRPQVVSAGLALNVLASLGCAGILYGISLLFNVLWQMPDLPSLFAWYPFLALAFGYIRFSDAARMMVGDFRGMFLSSGVFGGLYLLLTFLAKIFLGGLSLPMLLGLQTVAAAATPVLVRVFGATPIYYGSLRRAWLRRLFNFGRFGMGTNLFSMLFQRVDLLLLGAFVSPALLAVYNVATRLNGYLDLPLNSFGQAIFPKMAAEKNNLDSKLPLLFAQSAGLLLSIGVPSALLMILFAKPLVIALAGSQYLDAVPLVQILALSALIKPWGRMFGVTLDAVGAPQWNFRMLLFSFAVNLGVNALLIPKWGIYGAAVATVTSVFATVLTGQWLLQRLLPVRMAAAFDHFLPSYRLIFGKIRSRLRGAVSV